MFQTEQGQTQNPNVQLRILIAVKDDTCCQNIRDFLEQSIDESRLSALRFVHVLDEKEDTVLQESPLNAIQALRSFNDRFIAANKYLQVLTMWAKDRFAQTEVSWTITMGDITKQLLREAEEWQATDLLLLASDKGTKWHPLRKNVVVHMVEHSHQCVHVIKPPTK